MYSLPGSVPAREDTSSRKTHGLQRPQDIWCVELQNTDCIKAKRKKQRWPLGSFRSISACLLSPLTHNIISETDGAECNEGEVETLAERPAFHITEEQGRDDQKQQAATDEEETHC